MKITPPASSPIPVDHGNNDDQAVDQGNKPGSVKGLQVLGTGTDPAGRPVHWVKADSQTAAMFADALARTYGSGIASAVTNELGIQHNDGLLSRHTINKAIDMAETSRHALEGVDFALRLDYMAGSNSAAFLAVCADTGINADELVPQQRQDIDAAMEQHFQEAARAGQSPVTPETARGWLTALLSSLTQDSNKT